MKFQKHQAIFANDATWADAVVRYGMLKKIIKSYHKSPKSPKPVQRKSDIVTAVSADPNNAVGGGILADWNNNNSYDGKEVEEEEEHEMITDIETLKNTLQAALDEDIAACNKQWANDVDTVRSFAKELQQLEGPPSEQKLQQLRLQIQNCFDYANLQERAFECIMRKWDKRINFGKQSSLSSESFLERLKLEPFMDANSLDEELVICQELMMRISAYIGGASNELDLSQELFDKRAVVVSTSTKYYELYLIN